MKAMQNRQELILSACSLKLFGRAYSTTGCGKKCRNMFR